MSTPPDENVPEAIPDRPHEATGEISMLPPEEAKNSGTFTLGNIYQDGRFVTIQVT